jgi:hypothetical protein
MLTAMPRRPYLPLAAFAVLALAATAAACGHGGRPAAVASTLTPSPTTSTIPAGSPSPGASPGASAHPTTSPGVVPTSTPATTPTATAAPSAKVTDASIRADLIKRLGASPTLVGLEIQVRVQNRIVYLFGTVKTRREKATAEHIAVTEPGIKKVVSLLSVVPGGGGY